VLDSSSSPNLWKVAVDAPLSFLLTYLASGPLTPGQSVLVPLGKRKVSGVVIEPEKDLKQDFELKSIAETTDLPSLSHQQLQWALWLSKYYHHPPGEVFSLFFPSLPKKGRAAVPQELFTNSVQEKKIVLNSEQNFVVEAIEKQTGFSTHLLWGVTGSGKTEVYIELIKKKLQVGLGAMILVPEIALTPQLVSRFRAQLGDQMAVLHSHLTDREKTNQWWSVIEGKKRVLIGARSALFCPMPNLGLIVVDEEHEASYKQDETLRYNARDAAVMRAHFEKIPIILGTATPSLETWKNVVDKKYQLHTLKQRASSLQMPEIHIIDLNKIKEEVPRESFLPHWLSSALYNALSENYKKGFQSALFLNRRGIAQTVLCNSCGFIYKCANCEISLTLHGQSHLVCHYCDYSQQMAKTCPACHEGEVKPIGIGTEQIQDDLKKLFPHANVFRVDRDEIDSRQGMEEFVEKMENGEIQFLVGTQMIAKGLDFEKLTLVGIVLADVSFHIPDFRASERSYQLITQVSGRSGRHHKGQVLVQTYKPDHPSLRFAQNYDTEGFLTEELAEREGLFYPPFYRMACLKLSANVEKTARELSQELANQIKAYVLQKNLPLKILGPAPAPLFRLRNRFRFQILLKSASLQGLHETLQFVTHLQGQVKALKVQIDMDPYNLM
jgi:primosomal protein N' (replication factor Y) (superfamily II helicase)